MGGAGNDVGDVKCGGVDLIIDFVVDNNFVVGVVDNTVIEFCVDFVVSGCVDKSIDVVSARVESFVVGSVGCDGVDFVMSGMGFVVEIVVDIVVNFVGGFCVDSVGGFMGEIVGVVSIRDGGFVANSGEVVSGCKGPQEGEEEEEWWPFLAAGKYHRRLLKKKDINSVHLFS